MSQVDRFNRIMRGAEAYGPGWLQSALVTEQVVDMLDPVQFPEMALAREHLRKLREAEAINAMESGR